MLADRIDVLEHRPQTLAKLLAGVSLATLGVVAAKRLLRA
jgi:hypothetical protein